MSDKLIKLCGLYRNVSQKTGREYFSGNLTLFSKVLVFENPDRQSEKDPPHILFLAEREPPQGKGGDRRQSTKAEEGGNPDPGGPMPRRLKAVAKR